MVFELSFSGIAGLVAGAFLLWVVYLNLIYPYVIYTLRARQQKCGQIPIELSIPFGIPMTAKFLRWIKSGRMLQNLAKEELSKPYKTVLRQSLFRWVVATRDPENIKAILATKFNDYGFGHRILQMEPIFGSGIFTQHGNPWKHSRAMLRPQFSKEQISRLTELNRHVNTLLEQIKKSGNEVEIQHYFHMLTMDTATEFLFGESVDSLKFSGESKGAEIYDKVSGDSVFSADFVESYTFLNKFALQRLLLNNVSFLANLTQPEYRKHLRRAQIFIDHYVHLALENENEKPYGDEESYVFSRELAKETRDPIVIRDQAFNILIAGRDTTASTLSYSFYYFAKYPQFWEKVKEDVWEVFPDGPDSEITYEGLRKLKYLQIYVKEVLRLAPVVPMNSRNAIRDTVLPRGGGPNQSEPVFVPKGTIINYSVYVLHRDPEIYGPDVEEFRPERWAPENKLPNSPMYSWGYIPFNGGPRICLGQQFALTELYLTITKLALNYDKVLPGEGYSHDLTDRTTLTTMVGELGVPVKLIPYNTK